MKHHSKKSFLSSHSTNPSRYAPPHVHSFFDLNCTKSSYRFFEWTSGEFFAFYHRFQISINNWGVFALRFFSCRFWMKDFKRESCSAYWISFTGVIHSFSSARAMNSFSVCRGRAAQIYMRRRLAHGCPPGST